MLQVTQLQARSPLGWEAVKAASFSVQAGECVAVIGPNGSGKSSLLKALTGEYVRTQGQISLNGTPIGALAPQQKAKIIALVAQNEAVDPRLTVREYVRLGRVPHTFCCSHDTHEQAVETALADVNLTAKSDRKMGQLSGGEQQRANIARAFAQEPKLLLLDEPTNHLDPLARLEILELVKQKGVAAIAVLHDLQLVAPFADQVILMSQQRMLECGSPEDVLQNKYITPTFGLNVLTFNHPLLGNAIHHFEAAQPSFHASIGIAS